MKDNIFDKVFRAVYQKGIEHFDVGEIKKEDTGAVHTLGMLLRKVGTWDILISATFFAVGSTLFSYLLLRGRMIPILLAWLGVGVDGSWGQMIDQARSELSRDPVVWWNITAAGASLFGLLLAVNIVGDAVRDILDPRTLRETS